MAKKVAIVISTLSGTGVPHVHLNLSKGFLDAGFDVDLVVARAEGALRDRIPTGVKLVDLNVSRVMNAIGKLSRYIRDNEPDAIIAAEEHINVAAIVAKFLARSRVPITVSSHVPMSFSTRKPFFTRSHWMKYAIRVSYPAATQIITVSDGIGDELAALTGLPRQSIKTVYNAVIMPEMAAQAAERILTPWPDPEKVPIILGAGKMSRRKGFHDLIAATARVRARQDVRLILLGTGPEEQALKTQARELGLGDCVYFPGFVANPFAYMSKAAVFVLSSINEGLPTVLIQAMGCGCVVVSTDCEYGPREILDDGAAGTLVKVGDVEEMAEAIQSALQQPTSPEVLADRAKQFELKHVVNQYRICLEI